MISKKGRRTIVVDDKEWYYKIRSGYDRERRVIVCDPITGEVQISYPEHCETITPSMVEDMIREWDDDTIWFA